MGRCQIKQGTLIQPVQKKTSIGNAVHCVLVELHVKYYPLHLRINISEVYEFRLQYYMKINNFLLYICSLLDKLLFNLMD